MSPLTVVILAIVSMVMLALQTNMFARNGLPWWWGLMSVGLIWAIVTLTPWPVWLICCLCGGIVVEVIGEHRRKRQHDMR